MKKTYDTINLIMNGRLVHLYEDAPQDKKDYLVKRVTELKEELKDYRTKATYMYQCNITTSIAVVEYDETHGMSRTEAIEEVNRYMRAFMAPQKEKYAKLFSKKWLWPLIRVIIPKAMTSANGKGFETIIVSCPKNELAFDTTVCEFNTVLREKGMTELGCMYCALDDYMYGDLPGFRFVRQGTLCRGQEKCDFRFVREEK